VSKTPKGGSDFHGQALATGKGLDFGFTWRPTIDVK